MNHALRHEEDREDHADGEQQVIVDAHQVHPEVADGFDRVPRNAANQRRGDGDAGGGGNEVVKGQPDHLREIGHHGFAHITLPVGVGREAHGRVEREIRSQRSEPLGIQRQQVLEPENGVGEQAAHQTKKQHGERVLFPIMFLVGIHSHHAIRQPLQRSEHGVEPGLAVGIEHAHEIKPHRLGDRRQREDIEDELNPARCLHGESSEFFRPNHGHEQVDEQQQGDNADDDGFHSVS